MRKNGCRAVERIGRAEKAIIIVSICFCLLLFGPNFRIIHSVNTDPGSLHAAPGDTQADTQGGTAGTPAGSNDTPSEADIADFAAEFDKDGDGEVDEPEEDAGDVGAEDEAAQDVASDQDDAANQDDRDDQDDSGDQDRENREDEYFHDEEAIDEDREDIEHTGKNRDDIDGEASPDYRLSGYDRYNAEGSLRRLGEINELTPLIEREEKMILEN